MLQFPESTTIDEVIVNLDLILKKTISENNHLCLFALVYRDTTKAIKTAIKNGRFENPVRMEKMDILFANLYLSAYQHYVNNEPASKSWLYAFNSKNEQLSIIQHILLGMNAHINLDLSVAASTVAKGTEIITMKNDFMTVNHILAELTNIMQKGLGKVSLMMKLLDFFGFRNDEKIINFSIKKAREFAWLNTMELALLDNKSKEERIKDIDEKVMELSKIIKNPPGRFLPILLKLISGFEEKNMSKLIQKMSNGKSI